MTSTPGSGAPAARLGRVRLAGALAVALLTLVPAAVPWWSEALREAWFDACQRASPRVVTTLPATIVDIDTRSLAKLGRWPWPRSLLADLVERVAAHQPAAVGIDIFMPEPDPQSPALARAIAAVPTVLAVAGMPEPTGMRLRAPPIVVQQLSESGADRAPRLERFAGALASVDELNRVAAGWGLVSADPARGVLRRLPLVADVDGTLVGAFALELFRVAAREPALRLRVDGSSVRGIAIGPAFVATEADGAARVYFSPRNAERYVSAVDILEGRADDAALRQRLVLIAVTGLGLGDYHYTPVGQRMPGSEIHAQLVENLFDGTLLVRPAWAPYAEAGAFALLGALLVWAIPALGPRNGALLAVTCVLLAFAASYAAFRAGRMLFDAATPAAGLALVFATLLVLTLAEAMRHRRALERVVQQQREQAARVAGELDAARRIQTAMLPREAVLAGERRADLAATMLPAREVGGDLYDFFLLDERRLFLLVGDVAGKGLAASIFMAVSKALYKSATLRTSAPELGALMSAANAEVSRDNPEMLFVTAFAGVLDLDTGTLAYCNAGHENPYLIAPDGSHLRRIADGDGPPLCVVDDFAYRGATVQLSAGTTLCVVTDGVTEAQDPASALYGRTRLEQMLVRASRGEPSARAIVDAICADVATFAAGSEPADDLTVLVLRWRGA